MAKQMMYMELNSEKIRIGTFKKQQLARVFEIEAKEQTINDGEIVDVQNLAEYIKNYLKENKIKSKSLGICLNSSQNIVRQFKIPLLEKAEEINGAIEIKLYETLPNILDTHYMSYKIYDKDKENMYGIVALAPKSVLRTYDVLAKKLGMKLETVDVAANCTAKYIGAYEKDKDSSIFIELGYGYTNLTLIGNGRVLINRFIVNGINLVELMMQKENKLDQPQVKNCLKGKYKDFGISRSQMKFTLNESFVDINNTLNQFMDYVKYNKIDEAFKGMCIYGDYGDSHYLKDYFADRFNVEVKNIVGDDRLMLNLKGCAIRN